MSTFDPLQYDKGNHIGFWWKSEGADCAQRVHDTVTVLRKEQGYITERYRKALQYYENINITVPGEDLTAAWQFNDWDVTSDNSGEGPYDFNLIEAIVDTLHAEVITNRTKAQFITSKGNWLQQQKAIKNTYFSAGLFDETEMHEKIAPELAKDAFIFGDGFAKVFVDRYSGRVKAQRVFPGNVVFDEVEAATGHLSTFYEEYYVSRESLLEDYEDDADAKKVIINTPEFNFKNRPHRAIGDIVRVIEAWKVSRNGNMGRHVICTESGLIEDDEWEYEFYPFIHMVHKKRPRSILGKAIWEMICGHQETINDLRDKINVQLKGTAPFVWGQPGSGLKDVDFSNKILRVVESETPPQYISPQIIPPDLIQQFNVEIQSAMELIGVNQLMMKGEMPPGIVGNGKAMRIYSDIKSKRFMDIERRYESMHIKAIRMMLDLIEGQNEGAGYKLTYENKNVMDELDYKDIKLPKGSFKIRVYPANLLDDTPSGKLADLDVLNNMYPEAKAYFARMLENPDIEFITSQLSIQESSIQRIAEELLTTDTPTLDFPPIPFMNLPQAIGIMNNYIVDATSRGVPPEQSQKLIDWVKMANDMLNASKGATATGPAPGMPAPGSSPMTPQMPTPPEQQLMPV